MTAPSKPDTTVIPGTSRPRTFANPLSRDRATVLVSGEESGGEYLLIEEEVYPGGGPPLHYHAHGTERFTVVTGRLDIHLGDRVIVLGPGETATAPPMVPHRFTNSTDATTIFRVEVRPAGDVERGLRVVYALAREGLRITKRPLLMALIVQASDTYLPGPPLPVMRAVIGVLARVARLRGVGRTFTQYANT